MTKLLSSVFDFPPKNVLITECNRGLGIQLVNFISSQLTGSNILVTGKSVDSCREIGYLKHSRRNIFTFEMDSDSEISVFNVEKEMESFIKGEGINILINNLVTEFDESSVLEQGLISGHLDRSMLDISGPHLISKVFVPRLCEAVEKLESNHSIHADYKISLLANVSNFKYPKNSSKSLTNHFRLTRNMVNKSILKNMLNMKVVAVSIFPDKIQQQRKSPYQAVSNIYDILKKITIFDHGKYLDWNGDRVFPE